MIHFKIRHVAEVTSTNTLVLEAAKQGAQEGFVLVAGHQTAGHGKLGRIWLSPPGKNLLCSVLLRPPVSPARAPIFTQIACRAVAKVLKEHYDIASEFRRPNDVMVDSKKICGILVESYSSSSKLEAVVIGIGLNINADTSELPPEGISMKVLKNTDFAIDEVLAHLLEEMAHKCSDLYKETPEGQ